VIFISVNRKRKIRVEMRLTEDEHEAFLKRMRDIGAKNMDGFLRKMALTGYGLRLDLTEVRETLRLLNGATNNINQMVRRLNETRSMYASDVILLQGEIHNIRAQVADIMQVFGKVQQFMEF